MREFQNSRAGRALLAARQISTLHVPKIIASQRQVTSPFLIASAQILKIRLTHTKQTRKYFLIASFLALFAVRMSSARGRTTAHPPGNTSRAISNRNTPGFRKSANPWKQTRNDFLAATRTPMSGNIGTRRQQDCGIFAAAGCAKSWRRRASDSGSSASRCM